MTPDFLQRVLSPLAAQVIQRKLADSDKPLAEQSVDLSNLAAPRIIDLAQKCGCDILR